jgi:hypothetical protein
MFSNYTACIVSYFHGNSPHASFAKTGPTGSREQLVLVALYVTHKVYFLYHHLVVYGIGLPKL